MSGEDASLLVPTAEAPAHDPTHRLPTRLLGALVVTSALTLTACGADSTPEPDVELTNLVNIEELSARGADEVQVAAFDDGRITFTEYENAFARLTACVKSVGGQLANPDVVAYKERRAAALQGLMLECLTEAGVRMHESASLGELIRTASVDPESTQQSSQRLDEVCYATWGR